MTTPCLLSICIPTLNRGQFIGETLDSIVDQLTPEVEIVIVDGGSTDETESVVRGFIDRFARIRYVKRDKTGAVPSNEGFDRDCAFSVELAAGEYCWLMPDDDLLAPGAIGEVLARLGQSPDLVMACITVCNIDFSKTLVARLPSISADRHYARPDWLAFASEFGTQLVFVGRVIIRRAVWRSRPRELYVGSGFIHVGVVLSEPMESIIVVAKPLVIVRAGNALWTSRRFDIWMYRWPNLVWSLNSLSDAAKAAITPRFPSSSTKRLLFFRAHDAYSMQNFRSHLGAGPGALSRLAAYAVAAMPVVAANALCALFLAVRRRPVDKLMLYEILRCGHAAPLTRRIARMSGVA